MNNLVESIKKQKRRIIEVSYKARQGHLSSSMSIMEMINVLGSICLDATCKMRKVSFPPTAAAKKGKNKNKEA